MSIFDLLAIPTLPQRQAKDTSVYKDHDSSDDEASSEIKKTTSSPMTPKKNKIPRMLLNLQEELTDNLLTPTSRRKRVRSSPDNNLDSSPKKRIVTSSPSKKPIASSFLSTPPTTPQKSLIQKPALSLIGSSPKSASAKKRLNFENTLPSLSSLPLLISPSVTPVKKESSNIISQDPVSKKLDFTTPSKPRLSSHIESDKENVEPITPPFTPRKRTIYTKAKSYFHRSYRPRDIEHLPERHLEAQALKSFFIDNITEKRSTSLYISGPPGTGKTAQINLALSQFIDTEDFNAVRPVEIDGADYKIGYTYINCMTVNSIKGIFSEIYSNLTNKKASLRNAKEDLLNLISNDSFSDMNIIVLDELDKLITEDQQVLFELFAWTILEKSNLMLIGISNALDMVDRLLPRLKTNGLNPNTLVFKPYTADQIASIIRSRLSLLNSNPDSSHIPLFHPSAISLCSKKAASNSGDLRKALDICRNAIELVERNLKYKNRDELTNIYDYDELTAPQVKISDIAKVCSNIFNQNQVMKLQTLNLQQKIMLCMLVKAEEENPFKTLDLNSFFEYYVKNSTSNTLIGVLKKGEFLEIISNMESIGVLRKTLQTSKFSNAKVSSTIIKKDLSNIVKNIPLLDQMLNGTSTD